MMPDSMPYYDGWIVCWRGAPCWWTAASTRSEAIGKVIAAPLFAGRSWRQLRRDGCSARRLTIEDFDARPLDHCAWHPCRPPGKGPTP